MCISDMLRDAMSEQRAHRESIQDADFEFSGELQAVYFSKLREHLCSDAAYIVMHSFQDTSDLLLLKTLMLA